MKMLVGLTLASLALFAQPQPPPPAGRLQIDVVAIGGDGVPVTDLRPAEFEVWISGYRIPIDEVAFFTPEQTGRTVVVLLDNGAIGPALAPRVKEAARLLVNRLGEHDRMAVLPLYGGTPALSGDKTQLLQAVEAYRVQGFPFRLEDAGQHVLQAVATVARRFPETAGGRKTIVAIGAGWLFDTPLPPPGVRDLGREWIAAMRAMAASNTALYVIDPAGVGTAPFPLQGGSGGFARETGGHAFMNTNDVTAAVTRIWREAGTYYMLRTVDPPVQRGADLRELDVKVLRKGVTVRARRAIPGAGKSD